MICKQRHGPRQTQTTPRRNRTLRLPMSRNNRGIRNLSSRTERFSCVDDGPEKFPPRLLPRTAGNCAESGTEHFDSPRTNRERTEIELKDTFSMDSPQQPTRTDGQFENRRETTSRNSWRQTGNLRMSLRTLNDLCGNLALHRQRAHTEIYDDILISSYTSTKRTSRAKGTLTNRLMHRCSEGRLRDSAAPSEGLQRVASMSFQTLVTNDALRGAYSPHSILWTLPRRRLPDRSAEANRLSLTCRRSEAAADRVGGVKPASP